MRARRALLSLVCATGLVLAGCSTDISGSPQLPGASGGVSGDASSSPVSTGASGTGDGTSGPDSSANGGSAAGSSSGAGSSADGGSAGGGAPSGDDGDAGLPSASGDDPGLPPGLPSGLPTDLGSIPGLDTGCLAVAGLVLGISVLFLGPLTGHPLTESDVDQAFADADKVPPDVQQAVQVLHDAAEQAVGKSSEQAQAILDSTQVNEAMTTLSNYADDECG